jgi:protein SCO1/2
MTSRSKFLSFALLCIAAAAGALLSLKHSPKSPPLLATGTILAPARPLADFSLIDNHSREFGLSQLRGHWSLMFFGYTNCPDFCPSTLTTLAALEKKLRADKVPAPPQVIFVSVDAKRDTPSQLDKYVPYFDPQFIGLTARDQASIETLAKTWGVAVAVQPATDGNYTVDHSAALFVVDPAGNLAAVLTGPFTVEALAGDYARIVAARA